MCPQRFKRARVPRPTLLIIMVGMLEACMEVTTETGMTGDRRRPSRPKYTTKRKKPEKKKKRVKLYLYGQDSIKLWKFHLPSKKFLNVILLGVKPEM